MTPVNTPQAKAAESDRRTRELRMARNHRERAGTRQLAAGRLVDVTLSVAEAATESRFHLWRRLHLCVAWGCRNTVSASGGSILHLCVAWGCPLKSEPLRRTLDINTLALIR